jgi:hypothetical protein
MDRRTFLKAAAATGFAPFVEAARSAAATGAMPFVRVRPGDAVWPSQARWNDLFNAVGGRLVSTILSHHVARHPTVLPAGVSLQSFAILILSVTILR